MKLRGPAAPINRVAVDSADIMMKKTRPQEAFMIFDTHDHYYDDASHTDRDPVLTQLPGKCLALLA